VFYTAREINGSLFLPDDMPHIGMCQKSGNSCESRVNPRLLFVLTSLEKFIFPEIGNSRIVADIIDYMISNPDYS
jgi:hypothetical protein